MLNHEEPYAGKPGATGTAESGVRRLWRRRRGTRRASAINAAETQMRSRAGVRRRLQVRKVCSRFGCRKWLTSIGEQKDEAAPDPAVLRCRVGGFPA